MKGTTFTSGQLPNMQITPDNAHELQLFTYRDLARLCQVEPQTVQEWVRKGMIPSPQYFGFSARFTLDQVRAITQGRDERGTHPVTASPRRDVGKKGGNPPTRWKKKTAKKNAKKKTPPARNAKSTRAARLKP